MNTPSRQFPSVMTFGVSAIGRHLQTTDVDTFDLTLSDVEHERHPTEVVGGTVVEREVARAHQARTNRSRRSSRSGSTPWPTSPPLEHAGSPANLP